MRKIRFIAIILLVSLVTIITAPSFVKAEENILAAYPYSRGGENGMKTIFMDTFYGMAAGALIATAVSLTQSSPNWGKNLGTGAAIGGLAGAAFGIATEMKYLSGIEDGKVYVSIPSIGVSLNNEIDSKPDQKIDNKITNDLLYTAGLFYYKF